MDSLYQATSVRIEMARKSKEASTTHSRIWDRYRRMPPLLPAVAAAGASAEAVAAAAALEEPPGFGNSAASSIFVVCGVSCQVLFTQVEEFAELEGNVDQHRTACCRGLRCCLHVCPQTMSSTAAAPPSAVSLSM